MIKNAMAIICIGLLISCQKPQEPMFVAVKSIEITNVVGTKIEVEGQLVYFNPNPISATLKNLKADVYANDVPISKMNKDYKQEIKANSNFEIPMTATFELEDLINQNNLLGGILSAMTQKSVTIKYEGSGEFYVASIPFTIPFEYEEIVDLSR